MDLPTLTQIKYVLAVEHHGHFGKAAKACHVSQPSLSAQIQKIEEVLNCPLFDRKKKPIKLTDEGKLFVSQGLVILKEHKKLIELMQQSDEPSGDFRLGVIPTLAPYIIPLFVRRFAKKYPLVNLTISETKTDETIRMLEEDQLDCGLVVTPLNQKSMTERPIFYEPFYVFLANSSPLIHREDVHESELKAESVWLLDEGHCFRDQTMRICSGGRKNEIIKNVTFASGNLETLINLIRQGDGYTLLPQLATRNLGEEEKTTNLKKFQAPVPTREVSLLYSRNKLKIKIIDALFETIEQSVPANLERKKGEAIHVVKI